jgi:hypothetical protein
VFRPIGPRFSYPKAGPPSEDVIGGDPLDHDELLTARSACDEPNRSTSDSQLVRQQPQQRLVGGTLDGRRGHARSEDAIDDTLDQIGPSPRGQTHREPDFVLGQDSEQLHEGK